MFVYKIEKFNLLISSCISACSKVLVIAKSKWSLQMGFAIFSQGVGGTMQPKCGSEANQLSIEQKDLIQ